MKDRSEWIDSFKGLAILGVIMVHFGIGELSEVYEPYISSGRYGVQIFFIISAYLAFVSFEKIRKQNVFSWYRKKLIRILPLYWISIVIYLVTFGGAQYWLGSVGEVTFGNLVSHIFLLHTFHPY